MAELLHVVIVVLAVIASAVFFVGAAFCFGLAIYICWKESFAEPGEPL